MNSQFKFFKIILTAASLVSHQLYAQEPESPVNHYIVLFDASGSMKEFSRSNNFWGPDKSNINFMAQQLRDLVRKVLTEGPSDFTPIRQNDYFSFLFFHLNLNHPSYEPLEMFFPIHSNLLLSKGLPTDSIYYNLNYSTTLEGFSPIITAVKTALPFLSSLINSKERHEVNRIIIVRITDKDFGPELNILDEDNRIRDEINRMRNKGINIEELRG